MTELPPVKVPRVARTPSRTRIAPFALGLGVIGTAVFASLAGHRAAREDQLSALPPLAATTTIAPAPAPPAISGTPATTTVPVAIPMSTPVAVSVPSPPPPPSAYGTVPVQRVPPSGNNAKERARARAAAPALIVDFAPGPPPPADAAPRPTPSAYDLERSSPGPAASLIHYAAFQDSAGAPLAVTGGPSSAGVAAPAVSTIPVVDTTQRDLNANERFSNRAGSREPEVAHAQRLPNQESLVVEGTIIGAVMETALDSDLPGFARAIVTRDVLSFDGSQVLIPAGSHVIGEYNSGVAQGASRIFIVWNRLIRPDGVSVSLGSPAVDDLGRGGLGGKVNRHFFQRFGGAILLSVLTGGISALVQSRSRGSTVIVSSTNEASTLAGQAAQGKDIPPTIKTPQGATVRIFVARDLDFSGVGPTF